MKRNDIYAVKRNNELWAVIDCGETKTGGMTTGTFWQTHFKKDGKTYRWYRKLFNPPADLKEWSKIRIVTKEVSMVSDTMESDALEGWDDTEDLAYKTLSNFAALIGKPMSTEEVKDVIFKSRES